MITAASITIGMTGTECVWRLLLNIGLRLLLAGGLVSVAWGAPPRTQDMNILLILAEDWSAFALGSYGNPVVQTPHLDAFAARSVQFNRAYCQGTVCNPSRASLVTGLRPDSTGVYGNGEDMDSHVPAGAPSLAAMMGGREGSWAGTMGKLVHRWDGAYRFAAGFDFNEYTHHYDEVKGFAGEQAITPWPEDGPMWAEDEALRLPDPHGSRLRQLQAERSQRLASGEPDTWELRKPFQQYHAEMTGDSGLPEEMMEDGRLARRAVEVLTDLRDREEPFFLSIGLYATHTPLLAPKKYVELYDPAEMEPSPYPKKHDRGVPDVARRFGRNYDIFNGFHPEFEQTPAAEREALAAYYACATYLDAQVGIILDGLLAAGLAENTIVVFAADHGFQLGEHGMWSKFSLFEQSSRVPLIVHVPGAAANGSATDALVELVDIMPTLAEWWGIPPATVFEGESFHPLLSDPDQPWKSAVFASIPIKGLGRMVRTKDFRYSEWRRDRSLPHQSPPAERELYDLVNDPGEQRNLFDDPLYAAVVREMAAKLRAGHAAARAPRR
ncbi:MAG: sulfatase [Synoicihabitans sp.]